MTQRNLAAGKENCEIILGQNVKEKMRPRGGQGMKKNADSYENRCQNALKTARFGHIPILRILRGNLKMDFFRVPSNHHQILHFAVEATLNNP